MYSSCRVLAVCVVLLAAACGAAACRGLDAKGTADANLEASSRHLLKLDPVAPLAPAPLCIPAGDCKPQSVLNICPKGSTRDPVDPKICWWPCPKFHTISSDRKKCIPSCPPLAIPPWTQTTMSLVTNEVNCTRCLSKTCVYLPRAQKPGCYQRCGVQPFTALTVPIDFPIPMCCAKRCPEEAPIFISPTLCATKDGKQVPTDLQCKERNMCESETRTLPIIDRLWTSPVCPKKPPGNLGITTPNGLMCYQCTCGFPYQAADGSIKCTGLSSSCPANYKMCAPYCWNTNDPSIAAVLSLLNDDAKCAAFLDHFKDCIKPCTRTNLGSLDPANRRG